MKTKKELTDFFNTNYPKLDMDIYKEFILKNKLDLLSFHIDRVNSNLLIYNNNYTVEKLKEIIAYEFDSFDFEILTISIDKFLITFEF